jgi:DNA repair protein RecO (recombination protein O)
MSSGTRAVSVVLVGIKKETTHRQVSQQMVFRRATGSALFVVVSVKRLRLASGTDALQNGSFHESEILRSAQNDNLCLWRVESTEAILLRKRKFSDTSLIVSWCTESFGCVQTMAKGARRQKSPFAGKLDLFFEAEISIVRSRKSDLHTLTEVVLKNPFAGIRSNYLRTQSAAYFVELIEICTERDHCEPELFGLLRRAFGYLDANNPTARAVTHFETELARIAGVHDQTRLKADPAFALGNLFGRLPLSRTPLLKTLAAEAKEKTK